MAITVVTVAVLLYWIVSLIALMKEKNNDILLAEVCPRERQDTEYPSVAVLVAVRNEEEHIESALSSLLRLSYKNVKIRVVNDRSTDGTLAILERMQKKHPNLTITTVSELPPNWIGKSFAQYSAAQEVREDWILFTDGDVIYHPDALQKAIDYAELAGADHLAIRPSLLVTNWLMQAFYSVTAAFASMYLRPNEARKPASRSYIGIGPCNLVKTSVYRQVGGHERIALFPDDGMHLGKLIKLSGFRQHHVLGKPMIAFEWYTSLRSIMVGLEKNVFASMGYSIVKVLFFICGYSLLTYEPVVGVLVKSGADRLLSLATLAVIAGAYSIEARRLDFSVAKVLAGCLLANILFLFIIMRSVALFHYRGGIQWRDRFYSRAALLEFHRSHKIR